MNKLIFALTLAGISFGVISCTGESSNDLVNNNEVFEATYQEPTVSVINKVVSAAEFKELLSVPGAQIVDVRTSEEVALGKIEGAINFNFYDSDFEDKMSTLIKDKPVMVYCKAGGRSGKTAAMLKDLGFLEVYDLEGGYSNWSE